MVANTILEIYTLMFGWNMYGAIWDVLVGSGLALIPFIVAIISTFKDNYQSGESAQTIRAMETTLLGMVLVLMLCVLPFKGWPTSVSTVKYELSVPDCNPPANTSGVGNNTQTGYDATFSDMANWQVYKPVAWSLVQSVSTAITHTAIKSMTCVNNYGYMLLRINNVSIQSEVLKEELQQFYEACYKPALARFKQNPPNTNPELPPNVTPWDDIDWIGSRTLLGYQNEYYRHPDVYVSNMEDKGFSRQPSFRASDAAHQYGAYPSCYEVWMGEQNAGGWFSSGADGLREKLLDDIPDDEAGDILDSWKQWGAGVFSQQGASDEIKEDLLLKMVLENNQNNITSATKLDMSNDFDAEKGFWESMWDGSTTIMNMFTSANEFLNANAIKQMFTIAGPMILVMFQMVIIMAAPFVMIFGSYGVTSFFALAITWFSLEFINAIWAAAYWFDNRILQIYATNAGFLDEVANSALVKLVSMANILLLPSIWLSIMAFAGSAMLRGIGGGGVGGGVAAGSTAFSRGAMGTMGSGALLGRGAINAGRRLGNGRR